MSVSRSLDFEQVNAAGSSILCAAMAVCLLRSLANSRRFELTSCFIIKFHPSAGAARRVRFTAGIVAVLLLAGELRKRNKSKVALGLYTVWIMSLYMVGMDELNLSVVESFFIRMSKLRKKISAKCYQYSFNFSLLFDAG